jgi:hypothetical protein
MRDPLASIPSDEQERVVKPLTALEQVFRPLADSLRFTDEPAIAFDAAEDVE